MEPSPPLPVVALTTGDPAGIGPEIALAALADRELAESARIVAIGPAELRPPRVPGILANPRWPERGHAWIETPTFGAWQLGRVQESAGRAALAALRAGHELALAGRVDALVTGPVSKEALHLGGEQVEGQTELLGRWCGATRFEMLAIAGSLRVLLLTRHMPLVRALSLVSTERVLDRLRLLDEGLRGFGLAHPRIALAGLNPHAGENGLLGSEEDDLLRPAVRIARAEGLDVEGPVSPDSVFLQGSRGRYDGVLALYHDQAFIPIKLLSADGGITVILGLPYLRVSPVHGTAFDLAGKGTASPANLIAALQQAALWGGLRRTARTGR
ncbi:MAG: 4-hydroxythreonine-4-phosphate dehydrogenase PdxA [Planctomycetota bacterium]|nr:4-hydroxythreonine-4-phosphate dehydrogenase PdxA [Planctomycetota bacterium]